MGVSCNKDGDAENKANQGPEGPVLGAEAKPFRGCPPDQWRVRLDLSYDGADYFGWQRQTAHVSVQGTIESAVERIFGQKIAVLGASRTDAGVHAEGQVAHFDCPVDPSGSNLRYSLQCLTPPTLVVKEAFLAPRDFHAIASAERKTYRYRVLNRIVPSALRYRYTHWVRFPLDLDYLNEAAQFLLGRQDFKSVQTTGTTVKSSVREIFSANWERLPGETLEFTVTGDGFLKQMVRNIVGTLIDANRAGAPAKRVQEIIAARDRRRAGATAPPQGLYLHRVSYPAELDKKCRKL
jgi:tRNA pseudouridine38-40 synthase